MEKKVNTNDSFDMLGPYLKTSANCPFCGSENILVHLESYTSPVKPIDVCSHILAHEVGEYQNFIIFEG